MGLEAVINWILSIWRFITPCHWISPWEGGVRITYFKPTWRIWRCFQNEKVVELKSGVHFKIPGIQRVHQTVVASQTLNLPPQSLTTADGKNLNASLVVVYSIKSVVWFFTRIHDQDEYLRDSALRAVGAVVASLRLDEVLGEHQLGAEAAVLAQLKLNIRGKGYDVESVGFSDLQPGRALRILFGEGRDPYMPS